MSGLILIVEDEATLARNMREYLELAGHHVVLAHSLKDGVAVYESTKPEIAFIDYKLPDGVGTDLVRHIREKDDATSLVVITAYAKVQHAVEAIRAGASDYLVKPISLEEITHLVDKIRCQAQAARSLAYFTRGEQSDSGFDKIMGVSPFIMELKQRLRLIVEREAEDARGEHPPVLILGETGTGKGLCAKAIHFEGKRRDKPFIHVDCTSLSENISDLELFGAERGTSRAVDEEPSGLFLAAAGGTIFLDEISALPIGIQSKLLRALENRAIRPAGGVGERYFDAHVIAATNANLMEMVRAGEFRSDLYFRLHALVLTCPPLRQLSQDILLIAEHILQGLRKRYNRYELALAPETRESLLAHSWPGNVRELRNALEQSCVLTSGSVIRVSDLSLPGVPPIKIDDPLAFSEQRAARLERDVIDRAVSLSNGNLTLAAQKLSISRDTLRYRMEKLGIATNG